MAYGRILAQRAGGAAISVLKASPAGRAVSSIGKAVSSIFGGGTPGWSKSLRETKAAARAGDVATLQHKLKNSKYWQVRKAANQALLKMRGNATQSGSIGAGPAGLIAAGGTGTTRRRTTRRRRRELRRRSTRSTRSRSTRGKVKYRGRWYTARQARLFVPRSSRRRR